MRSALEQTHEDLEVVVVDDHSGDDTLDIVDAIGDDRVTAYAHQENRGGNAARRTAIEHSRGTYLAFLDADDMWYPQKLAAQLDRLDEAGPDYELAYTWFDSEYPDGRIVPDMRHQVEGRARPELMAANIVGTFSAVLVTRAAYDRVGGVDPSLPSCQDWEFYVRVNQVTGIACVPCALVRYWRGDDSARITSNRQRVADGHLEMYRRMAPQLSTLSKDDSLAARRYLMENIANQAATPHVIAMARDIPRAHWSPSTARFVARMVARSVKKGRQVSP